MPLFCKEIPLPLTNTYTFLWSYSVRQLLFPFTLSWEWLFFSHFVPWSYFLPRPPQCNNERFPEVRNLRCIKYFPTMWWGGNGTFNYCFIWLQAQALRCLCNRSQNKFLRHWPIAHWSSWKYSHWLQFALDQTPCKQIGSNKWKGSSFREKL